MAFLWIMVWVGHWMTLIEMLLSFSWITWFFFLPGGGWEERIAERLWCISLIWHTEFRWWWLPAQLYGVNVYGCSSLVLPGETGLFWSLGLSNRLWISFRRPTKIADFCERLVTLPPNGDASHWRGCFVVLLWGLLGPGSEQALDKGCQLLPSVLEHPLCWNFLYCED